MTLPPHTIRIKRRRNEDPVQTLLVESKRRRVDGEFCFILHDTVESAASGTASPLPPNGLKPQQLTVPGIPKESSTRLDDALKDSLQPGGFKEATSSDREGRPIAADRQLPIGKREIKKAVSPARSVRLKKKPVPVASRHRLSESISSSAPIDDLGALSPTTKAEVRRYHLSKKMKIENGAFGQVTGKKRERGLVPVFMEGAGRVAKKRSAIKIGTNDYDLGSEGHDEEDMEYSSVEEQQKPRARKKPQTHAKEKAMLQRRRSRDASRTRNTTKEEKPSDKPSEGLEFGFDSDELAKQLQDMVLDYISSQPDLNSYPTNPKSPVQEKKNKVINPLGGGVGGGTWADVEKRMDVDAAGDVMKLDSDGEEGEWVYDVYFREEIKKSKDGSTAVTNGDYGVLVISNSDDEQWWYENDEDEESASDLWGSDDEDSNAEEYYKNDYPDEDDYDAADSDNDYDRVKQYKQPRIRGRKKRGVWDYESDGSYDLEREDESD
ncbi:uncharacterized protein DFL_003914 [Arthrobotrys flagrans]|uniref:Transcription factor Iwr1 domain-containing protein n=1 Tax=Arthrobotrys flagrans TaxID=97331 RepID=A0A437A3I1_ARTFL|nr:hypothetical protein DFL_003914 [Arthrobotrys flagrans]